MSFNVSSINPYVNETAQGLIKKAVLTGKSLDLLTVVPGIKYIEDLNIMDNTITVAAASCGWSPAGSVAFKQRQIKVTPLEVKDALCEKTLEKYWLGQMMTAGSPKTEEVGPILAESYVEKVKASIETMIWAGASATTSCSGFIELLTADGGYVSASAASGALTAHTAANIVTRVDAMVALMPEVLYTLTPVMFMSPSAFRLYIAAMASVNLYHIDPTAGLQINQSWTNPLTGVKFIAIEGLTNKQDLFISYVENFVVGTDLLNEEEKFDIWYTRDNDEVRVNIQWKLGVQVQFPELIVYNK